LSEPSRREGALPAVKSPLRYQYKGTYNGSDGLTRTACGLANCRRAVLFVHVGKACGGSVKYSLEANNVSYAEVACCVCFLDARRGKTIRPVQA